MAIDMLRSVGDVTREVVPCDKGESPARVLRASRWFNATQADLWDALTNAVRLSRWFLPVSGDLKLGGRYRFEGNASGAVTACEPPCRLGVTWEWDGQVSWVVVELSAGASGSRLRLEHIEPLPAETPDELGPGAGGVGWDQAFLGLDQHLSGDAGLRPEEVAAWLASSDGRLFVTASSDAWCEASIAAGADPTVARRAAARTTAAYGGEATTSTDR